MKNTFSVSKKIICNVVDRVRGACGHGKTMPVLESVLIEHGNGVVMARATNLNQSVSCSEATGHDDKDAVAFCVSASKFFDVISKMPGDNISVECKPGMVTLSSGGAKFSMHTHQVEDFPKAKTHGDMVATFVVGAADLSEIIDGVAYAVSDDETRYVLNGACISADGKELVAVSTDGHRLHKCGVSFDDAPSFKPVIVPAPALSEIKKMCAAANGETLVLSIHGEGNNARLVAKLDGTWTLMTDLIDGQFPDHTKVMPTKIKHTATMPRADLLAAVRRAKLASPKSGHCVTLSLADGELTLNAISPEFGEAKETMVADHKGPKFSIGFNASYLADALTHLSGDTIKAQFQDELSPALWSGDSATSYAVTMPMRA